MVRIEGLTKRFGDRIAVDHLDLEVGRGETVAVVGPNGAGKTTLFRIICTLVKPDAGRVRIGGLDVVEDVRQVRRRLGYMPDEFGGYDLFSAEEYLDYFAAAYGLHGSARLSATRDVIDLCDLGPVREDAIGFLSRGIRQRLMLAKTLLHDPDLLVLDEPASGLDPRARVEIRAILRELGRMGKTVLVSSHILSEMAEICSLVVLLEKGRLVAAGGLSDLHERITVDRAIRIVPRGDAARAEAILRASPSVMEVVREGNEIQVVPADGSADPDAVLRDLLDAGVGVRSYREEEPDLERIFLRLTRGEIQ